jgi:hypothetical protein
MAPGIYYQKEEYHETDCQEHYRAGFGFPDLLAGPRDFVEVHAGFNLHQPLLKPKWDLNARSAG